jgi:uncharacterized membrane protein YdjX (TVP38/TMEM64 family)
VRIGARGAAVLIALLGAGAVSARWADDLPMQLGHPGAAGILGFALLQILVAATGILPASLIAIAAGASFGVAGGFLVCGGGMTIGGILAFLIARSALRPWIARRIGHLPAFVRLDEAVASGDWKIACLIRLSPVMPFAATSYGLGLTRMTFRSFLLGLVASLPALLGYVALGALGKAGLAGGTGAGSWFSGLMLGIGVAASIGLVIYLRLLLQRQAGRALPG